MIGVWVGQDHQIYPTGTILEEEGYDPCPASVVPHPPTWSCIDEYPAAPRCPDRKGIALSDIDRMDLEPTIVEAASEEWPDEEERASAPNRTELTDRGPDPPPARERRVRPAVRQLSA